MAFDKTARKKATQTRVANNKLRRELVQQHGGTIRDFEPKHIVQTFRDYHLSADGIPRELLPVGARAMPVVVAADPPEPRAAIKLPATLTEGQATTLVRLLLALVREI